MYFRENSPLVLGGGGGGGLEQGGGFSLEIELMKNTTQSTSQILYKEAVLNYEKCPPPCFPTSRNKWGFPIELALIDRHRS